MSIAGKTSRPPLKLTSLDTGTATAGGLPPRPRAESMTTTRGRGRGHDRQQSAAGIGISRGHTRKPSQFTGINALTPPSFGKIVTPGHFTFSLGPIAVSQSGTPHAGFSPKPVTLGPLSHSRTATRGSLELKLGASPGSGASSRAPSRGHHVRASLELPYGSGPSSRAPSSLSRTDSFELNTPQPRNAKFFNFAFGAPVKQRRKSSELPRIIRKQNVEIKASTDIVKNVSDNIKGLPFGADPYPPKWTRSTSLGGYEHHAEIYAKSRVWMSRVGMVVLSDSTFSSVVSTPQVASTQQFTWPRSTPRVITPTKRGHSRVDSITALQGFYSRPSSRNASATPSPAPTPRASDRGLGGLSFDPSSPRVGGEIVRPRLQIKTSSDDLSHSDADLLPVERLLRTLKARAKINRQSLADDKIGDSALEMEDRALKEEGLRHVYKVCEGVGEDIILGRRSFPVGIIEKTMQGFGERSEETAQETWEYLNTIPTAIGLVQESLADGCVKLFEDLIEIGQKIKRERAQAVQNETKPDVVKDSVSATAPEDDEEEQGLLFAAAGRKPPARMSDQELDKTLEQEELRLAELERKAQQQDLSQGVVAKPRSVSLAPRTGAFADAEAGDSVRSSPLGPRMMQTLKDVSAGRGRPKPPLRKYNKYWKPENEILAGESVADPGSPTPSTGASPAAAPKSGQQGKNPQLTTSVITHFPPGAGGASSGTPFIPVRTRATTMPGNPPPSGAGRGMKCLIM